MVASQPPSDAWSPMHPGRRTGDREGRKGSGVTARIAVVGMACRYPGAESPRALWEGILARRREFRRLPACRLPLRSYHDSNPSAPDKTYGARAAVLDGFRFDWAGMRIPKTTF